MTPHAMLRDIQRAVPALSFQEGGVAVDAVRSSAATHNMASRDVLWFGFSAVCLWSLLFGVRTFV